jgi:hypothetical protein
MIRLYTTKTRGNMRKKKMKNREDGQKQKKNEKK